LRLLGLGELLGGGRPLGVLLLVLVAATQRVLHPVEQVERLACAGERGLDEEGRQVLGLLLVGEGLGDVAYHVAEGHVRLPGRSVWNGQSGKARAHAHAQAGQPLHVAYGVWSSRLPLPAASSWQDPAATAPESTEQSWRSRKRWSSTAP